VKWFTIANFGVAAARPITGLQAAAQNHPPGTSWSSIQTAMEKQQTAAGFMSLIGTNAKCRPHRAMSEFEGKAEDMCSY
jgi:hypothetical protein